jgi:serine/threonine-protein kinase
MYEAFAVGGMASVHLGRMTGPGGFSRTVAIKQLHSSFGADPAGVSTLLDEARVASRVQHPNVVSTLDVVVEGADILLVLEYVHGESLARLLAAAPRPPPIAVVNSVVAAALHGLHAAHEATAENGEPLGIVHRDVSPQNVIVGVDGMARVLDFGIAKARGRLQTTQEGQVKGKLAYMAPEQIRSGEVSRQTDVFAAGIVLWEALTGTRLFAGDNEGQVIMNVLGASVPPPSSLRPEIGAELDAIVLRALERDRGSRFATARELAVALEARGIAAASSVGQWVEETARDTLERRAARVAAIEQPAPAAEPIDAHRREAPTVTATVAPTIDLPASDNHPIALDAAPPRVARSKLPLLGMAAVGSVAAVALAVWAWPGTSGSAVPAAAPSPSELATATAEPSDAPPAASATVVPAPSTETPHAEAGTAAPNQSASQPKSAPRIPIRAPAPTGAARPPPPAASAEDNPFYRFE